MVLAETEVGAPMGLAFAVDEAHGRAWVGDWGFLREVDLATRAVRSIDLGEHPAVRAVAVDPGGTPWVLAERDTDPVSADGFRAPASGPVTLAVLRVDGDRVQPVVRCPFGRGPAAPCLAITDDGTLLVPHELGAALVRPDGGVIRRFPASPTKYCNPAAAVDRAGRFVVTTMGEGKLRRWDLAGAGAASDDHVDLHGPFEGVMALHVSPDGTILVEGGVPDYDLYRVPLDGGISQLGQRGVYYGVSPDGRRVYLASYGQCAEMDVERRVSLRTWPVEGMDRKARIVATERGLYARTDRGVLQRLGA